MIVDVCVYVLLCTSMRMPCCFPWLHFVPTYGRKLSEAIGIELQSSDKEMFELKEMGIMIKLYLSLI